MNKMTKVGVLTIGQSPRNDVTPSIQNIVGPEVTIIERGGLDQLAEDHMHEISPGEGEKTYISKLRNGEAVKIGKTKLLPLLQKELSELEKEVDVILMLCTGDFPALICEKPIIYPDKVLSHVLQAVLAKDRTLGLIIPLEEQRDSLVEKWEDTGFNIEIGVSSPYEKSNIRDAATQLKEKGASIIVLDCMGYNETHKHEAKEASNVPVILSRTLAARIVQEYIT